MSPFAHTIMSQKYLHEGENTWEDIATRVVTTVMEPCFPDLVDKTVQYVTDRKFIPGGRYLYATGKRFHQTQNCLLMRVGDSREEWARLNYRATSGLMTGAGIGVVYSDLRGKGARVGGMGGESTGPLALMQMVNEIGRHVMQGGSRRAAIWAGLHWWHPDIFDFMRLKDWSQEVRDLKEKDFNHPATMDTTNISVILDTQFFDAMQDTMHEKHEWAQTVYWKTIDKMLTTGEPGFSIDAFENEGENLRNACTEITSRDDDDICNLGSLNLARIENIAEMEDVTYMATHFLLAGTRYSTVPYQAVDDTRTKNRRLGLGFMGVYEWLVKRGKRYGPDEELADWLDVYATSGDIANDAADRLGISRPVKTRGVAPTGTLAILGETTSSIEPMIAAAIKRRYLKGDTWHYQYVIDATAQRLLDQGIDPALLEDAYDLAEEPERRIAFQAWVQKWVDHGISSTLNLPTPEAQVFTHKEFGDMLFRYLPQLRGVTCYPDGARGGQPLTKVPLAEAFGQVGYEYEEIGNGLACLSGVCSI
jgi:ribonucleoside-diphosphate reductase alpha chain